MDNRTNVLLDRTFEFGLNTLKLLNSLEYSPVLSVPINQLARSATSIGANYEEAQAAESSKDFSHKVGISSKECRESVYWLKMLNELYPEKSELFENKIKESIELRKIFISIKKSTDKSLGRF